MTVVTMYTHDDEFKTDRSARFAVLDELHIVHAAGVVSDRREALQDGHRSGPLGF